MGLQSLLDRVLLKVVRNHRTSAFLRRRYAKNYGIEVGLHTFGAFDRWRIVPGTRVGRYCSIAGSVRVVEANHTLDGLSTSPYFYLSGWGMVDHDDPPAPPTIISDDVWIGHNATLTPECKHVGRGAVIGAGAIVTRDVPPYAVVAGVPARVLRYRFSPDMIEAIEATRWWELEPAELRAASRLVPEFLHHPTVGGAQAFIRALGRPEWTPAHIDESPPSRLA